MKTDLENALPATAQSALAIGEIYTFLSALALRKEIQTIFMDFQNVYDTCECIGQKGSTTCRTSPIYS